MAEQDLEDIWFYTAQTWSVDQAENYQDDINSTFDQLLDNPFLGPSIEYIRPGYRKISVNHHIIYYQWMAQSKNLVVIRILHEKMDTIRHF